MMKVVYSRTADKFVSLADRTTMANKAKADIFVSIHANSFTVNTARGLETFSHPGSTAGRKLASDIQSEILKDKTLYSVNRGLKTANFYVLRVSNMPAALTELAFISNPGDATILRTKQKEFAKQIAAGIRNNVKPGFTVFLDPGHGGSDPGAVGNGLKEKDITLAVALEVGRILKDGAQPTPGPAGTPIVGKATATIDQMKAWAKNKRANKLLIDLAPNFYALGQKAGINPALVYAQSAKETGYMKFGGVLNASFFNTCGLKTSAGGGDKDPDAHKRFKGWDEGIQAQIDHLALYAGAAGYPKAGSPDPRHFPYLKGTAKTVESLGGKWAPSASYGTDIVKMMKEIEGTKATAPTPAPKPQPSKKSNAEVAREVMAGKWGNGATRKSNLEKAGYNYNAIQVEVNKLVAPKPPTKAIKVGGKVTINKAAKSYSTGQTIPAWAKKKTYTVSQVSGQKALLREITSWVNFKDLTAK